MTLDEIETMLTKTGKTATLHIGMYEEHRFKTTAELAQQLYYLYRVESAGSVMAYDRYTTDGITRYMKVMFGTIAYFESLKVTIE